MAFSHLTKAMRKGKGNFGGRGVQKEARGGMASRRFVFVFCALHFFFYFNVFLFFYVLHFFYTLTYEHVGKIQKTERKTKHLYISDLQKLHIYKKEINKKTNPSTFFSIYMKKKVKQRIKINN